MLNKNKAIALYSGGLDSILAIKLILEQGIDVIGIIFETPFIAVKNNLLSNNPLGITFIKEDISKEFQNILLNPKYGFGKNINPCIDCRILMYKKAGEVMKRENASFIISGEVLGQRPMSQNKRSLLLISKESGYGQFITRPLSALLLPETEPEKQKIIDRSRLLDIQGRSRKRQIFLAEYYKINNYPAPAGGCKLTEPGFSDRLSDLLVMNKNYSNNDIELLKVGRHFLLGENTKLLVGRNEKENAKILALSARDDYLLDSHNFKGPISLLRFYGKEKDPIEIDKIIRIASRITAKYCDKDQKTELLDINISNLEKNYNKKIFVQPFTEAEIKNYLI